MALRLGTSRRAEFDAERARPGASAMQTPKMEENAAFEMHATPRLSRLELGGSVVSQSRLSHLSITKDQSHRVLGTLSIIGLCYFSVSGGPVGSEYVMSSGGPLMGIIFLLLFPFFWGIPIAYITAELSTAFPEDGGYTVWVLEAFGPFWGFQTGYWAWVSGVIDNAIYPALAVSTFTDAYGDFGTPVTQYLVKAAIAVALTLPNLFGIRIVGGGMIAMSIFVMVPFVLMSFWGMAKGDDWSALGEIRRSDIVYDDNDNVVSMTGSVDIDWSTLINTLFWNFNGAVAMSSFGGEVVNPGRTYPRAMLISVLLIALTYILPLVGATVMNSPDWTTWEDGSFSSISEAIGGKFLLNWIVVATFVSNAGMYIAELFCDSFQLLGMAECGLAPAFFKARNKRFDTPHNAIFASLLIIFLLIKFDFEDIQSMTNALSAFYQLLILFAFIKLRYSHKDVRRPFKVPGPMPLLILALVVPTALLLYIAVDVFFTLMPAILVAVFTVIGVAYARWCNFSSAQIRALRVEDS